MSKETEELFDFAKLEKIKGAAIAWHLVQSYVTPSRILIIEIEQRVSEGSVSSVTITPADYVIFRTVPQRPLMFLYGIFACERCELLAEQMGLLDEYDSVSIRTRSKDEATGAITPGGLRHWSESCCDLRLRHNNKSTRFGYSSSKLRALAEA